MGRQTALVLQDWRTFKKGDVFEIKTTADLVLVKCNRSVFQVGCTTPVAEPAPAPVPDAADVVETVVDAKPRRRRRKQTEGTDNDGV